MTEEEWLSGTSATELLRLYHGKLNKRKLRLFAAACCRRLEPHLIDQRSLDAILAAERFADGALTRDELRHHQEAANDVWNEAAYDESGRFDDITTDAAEAVCQCVDRDSVYAASHSTDLSTTLLTRRCGVAEEHKLQLRLARCVFGNPFRPVAFNPRWRSESAVALARTAYDTRNFSLLPILADALEDAGCDSPAALAHLREPDAPHARGCWVVDLVLGK